ncbi:MAG: hypothetical protein WC677_08725 [Clostridia bacterium]|jgi:hypothetical protein
MNESITCDKCGKPTELITDNFMWHNAYLGDLSISNVKFYKCKSCSNKIIPFETAIKIDEEEHKTLQGWLWKQSADASEFNDKFWSNKEVVQYLGVSRAAIHKSLKYKGLIYHVIIGKEAYFYAESVKLFKDKGDGRLPIYNETIRDESTLNGLKFIYPYDDKIKYNVDVVEKELSYK